MGTNSRKMKVSKAKHSNQVITKLKKQGKIKMQRHRKRKIVNREPKKPVATVTQNHSDEDESVQGDEMIEMMEEEDLQYLLKTAAAQTKARENRKRKSKDDEEMKEDDMESEYESTIPMPEQKKKTKQLLPIKTKHGFESRSIDADELKSNVPQEEEEEEMEFEQSDEEDESKGKDQDSDAEDETPKTLDKSNVVSATDIMLARYEDVQNKKITIGSLCSGLLESPELKLSNFFTLFYLMDDKNKLGSENLLTVRKLAMVSALEVFKDILPDYQFTQQDFGEVKLKKDTLALNKFETALLGHYKRYLQRLEKMTSFLVTKKGDTRKISASNIKLANVAITCMCDLLVSHPYFNYSTNIGSMLVPFLNHRNPSVRSTVNECFKTVFKDDRRGLISLTVVRKINQFVKTRSNDVNCEVLYCMMALRIKDVNLDVEKKLEMKQKKQMSHKQRLISMSKKERKRNKKLKELEKEMLETKAEENKQSKQQNLTEITKVVFMIYFRILKRSPNSKLLSATLEGLSKFAHVMNIEFFSDLVNVLHGLLRDEDLGYRERLHCVETVFAVLSGQGDVLNIDPTRFYSHLYKDLLTINAGRNHADLLIILRTLTSVLIKRRKKVSQQVLLAFIKRATTLSMQVLHNGTLGCLGIIKTVLQQSKATDVLLELDQEIGSGRYDPYLMEPEYCNASTTALYELTALRQHYHPTVRMIALNLMNGVPTSGEGSLPVEIGKLTAEQLFEQYDGSKMTFKPSIPPPKKVAAKTRPGRHIYTHPNFENYCIEMANKKLCGPFDFTEVFQNKINDCEI